MGRRPVLGSGAEQDAYTGWRRVLRYLDRPGVVKRIKRSTHKRERREAAREIRLERTPDE